MDVTPPSKNLFPSLEYRPWMSYVIYLLIIKIAAVYYLFQKHKLPQPTARIVGRIYFWPTLPFVIVGFGSGLRGNWWDEIDDRVYLGAVPLVTFGHVEKLYRLGVRAVINLCDEYEGPVAEYKKKGIHQLRVPTVDHYEPSVDVLEKAVLYIQSQRAKGVGVYIHCRAGHGRSAAVALCWLVASKGMSLQEAQEKLIRIRTVRKKLWQQQNINSFYKQKLISFQNE